MKINDKDDIKFEFTKKFRKRAEELLADAEAMQFAEALKLGNVLGSVFERESERLAGKYGEASERFRNMRARSETNDETRKIVFARYTSAKTPTPKAGDGWVVDGFVRTPGGSPVDGVTVAAYDRAGKWLESFGHTSTDKCGYFSLRVDDLPEDPPSVFLRASRGRRRLPSEDVRVQPIAGATERVDIVIDKDGSTDEGGRPDGKPPKHPPDTPTEPPKGEERPQPSEPPKDERPKPAEPKPAEPPKEERPKPGEPKPAEPKPTHSQPTRPTPDPAITRPTSMPVERPKVVKGKKESGSKTTVKSKTSAERKSKPVTKAKSKTSTTRKSKAQTKAKSKSSSKAAKPSPKKTAKTTRRSQKT